MCVRSPKIAFVVIYCSYLRFSCYIRPRRESATFLLATGAILFNATGVLTQKKGHKKSGIPCSGPCCHSRSHRPPPACSNFRRASSSSRPSLVAASTHRTNLRRGFTPGSQSSVPGHCRRIGQWLIRLQETTDRVCGRGGAWRAVAGPT